MGPTPTGQRVDWLEFFRLIRQPHGVRLRLSGFDSTSDEAVRAEKRLIRLVRMRAKDEIFAARRSYGPGSAIIDCVFRSAGLAGALAREIGALPCKPPLGWTTAHELVADDNALRKLLKLGAEARADDDKAARPNDSANDPQKSATPDALGDALLRLALMSMQHQASTLIASLTTEPSSDPAQDAGGSGRRPQTMTSAASTLTPPARNNAGA